MKNILFIDVESTGTNYDSNELVEIACLFFQNEKLTDKFVSKLNISGNKLTNLSALKINKHQLTAPCSTKDRQQIAYELADFLVNLPSSKENPIYVGGHNVAFDVQMLKEFLKEQNIIGWSELFSFSLVDTSTIGNFLRDCNKLQFQKMSLANLAESLAIKFDKSKTHGAEYDAELAAKCYFSMLDRIKTNYIGRGFYA